MAFALPVFCRMLLETVAVLDLNVVGTKHRSRAVETMVQQIAALESLFGLEIEH